jgi:hypothetical protein
MDTIKIGLHIKETSNETYPIFGSLYVGSPKSLLPEILLTSGMFRTPESAKKWGHDFMEILGEHVEWMEIRSTVDLDKWVLAMTPPDDFERDHAQ